MPLERFTLNKGWEFKQATSLNDATASSFLPVSRFPTVQFMDLLHHKLISDPYVDTNELDCLWVNDADWTYRTRSIPIINLPDTASSRAILVFDGLDIIVDVFLNEQLILSGKNMHISYRVDVTDLLRDRTDPSVLELRFKNAPAYGRKERERIGYRGNPTDVHFGGSERLFVRKAQYQWGWDWGPAVNTSGPWKDIHLETFVSRIEDFLVTQLVAPDLETAKVTVKGTVESHTANQKVELTILDPDGRQVKTKTVEVSNDGSFESCIELTNLKLWYPFTYGAQPLYTIKAVLQGEDERTQKLGLRRLRLLQHPLKNASGTSFVFEINNVRVFAGGSCWIPGDFMLPRMTRQRYEDWLLLAKSGNQAMIRVWGGGLVESDHFYDICDREGILVWQDLLFACGNYPASDDFVENVKEEAEQQVKRVGYHPSLVLWAGNNEDYMLAELWGWEYDAKDQEGPWDKTDFPARKIYERILPEICERLAGDVPYWRSSPYGGETANDVTVGDTHIWNVWHGQMSPYQDYKSYTSRFVSEFGFESAPDIRTLHKAITDPKERHWQSRTFDAHDKGPGHQRRYGMYSGENFRFRFNPLQDFVYCTQFLQAEAMSYAYNGWKREFRGPGEENCSGILVWQLNDIWQGTSWALVDVDLHRKPSFYITKRALAPVVVGMDRVVTKRPSYIVTSYSPEKAALDIWAVNSLLKNLDATLKLSAFDIESGKEIVLGEKERPLSLKPNQTTEIARFDIPYPDTTVVVGYIDDLKNGERLARWVSWPEPMKFVRFNPDLKIDVKVAKDSVLLKSNAPTKGVVVSVPIEDGEDAIWDDNFVDLVPGEEIKIGVEGLNGRKVQTRYLCDWEQEKEFKL
ncbi:glycoside hydrolase family 2 protein [Phlyctema vagabunda]|uniref:Beta-mannosidase B n=1 Tax=Phlyctema vagabunda TaxID=108571 RepID=A0ABR4PCH7_9HELO